MAGAYSRMHELIQYRKELEDAGHTVVSSWLDEERAKAHDAMRVEEATENVPMEAKSFAEQDREELYSADALIIFSEKPFSGVSRGGRHVEFGMALAWDKPIFVVGPRENVFYTLDEIVVVPTWKDFWSALSVYGNCIV